MYNLPQVCPGASSTRQLRVFNATDLPFPFHWSVTHSQPQFDSSTASSTALSTVSPFTVTPAAGVLQAQAEVSFSVEFAPQFTAPHTGALKLCVQRSGDAGLLSISQWGMEGTAIIDLSSTAASANGLATLAKASAVRTTAASCSSPQRIISEDAAGEDNAGAGDVSIPCDPDSSAAAEEEGATGERQQASAWPGNSDWQVVADVAVEGVGCVISLTVEPAAALRVPGTLTVGQETSLPLQLRNDTAAPACFTIAEAGPAPVQNSVNGHGPSADVVVLPSQGVVPPHSVLDLAMHFTALRAGSHQQGFVLEVLHGRRQHLQADVAVQQVRMLLLILCKDTAITLHGYVAVSAALKYVIEGGGGRADTPPSGGGGAPVNKSRECMWAQRYFQAGKAGTSWLFEIDTACCCQVFVSLSVVLAPAAVWPVAAGESCAQLSMLGFWCAVCRHQRNTHTAAAKYGTTQQQLLVHSTARQSGVRQPGRRQCTALHWSMKRILPCIAIDVICLLVPGQFNQSLG